MNCAVNLTTIRQSTNSMALDCSAYISGYPISSFIWSVPPEFPVTNESFLSSPMLILQGKTGSFSCAVTNSALKKTALVVFNVSHDELLSVECTTEMRKNYASALYKVFEPRAMSWLLSSAIAYVLRY